MLWKYLKSTKIHRRVSNNPNPKESQKNLQGPIKLEQNLEEIRENPYSNQNETQKFSKR